MPNGIRLISCTRGGFLQARILGVNVCDLKLEQRGLIGARSGAAFHDATVSTLPVANVAPGMTISANTGAIHSAVSPVTIPWKDAIALLIGRSDLPQDAAGRTCMTRRASTACTCALASRRRPSYHQNIENGGPDMGEPRSALRLRRNASIQPLGRDLDEGRDRLLAVADGRLATFLSIPFSWLHSQKGFRMSLSAHHTAQFAILSCLGWIGMFAAKKSGYLWAGNCLGLVYHIALSLVVQALPAPEFVRMAGYVWLFSDAMIDVCSINAMAEDDIWALRMGVHVPASVWIVGSSLHMTAFPLAVGCVLGACLALHAVIGPRLDDAKKKLLVFVLPTMTLWLVLVAVNS